MRDFEVGSAHSHGPGVTTGMLQVGYLPDGYPMEIPVIIVQGAQDGPVLWMHGCVHGNEYCGAYSIHQLVRTLDPAELKGAVVALPVLNITAFQRQQRMSPFEGYNGGDLNRHFPGNPAGTLTDQLAWHVWQPFKKYADFHIDMHTAMTPDTRWALFAPAEGPVGVKAEAMARAFGYENILPSPLSILGGSSLIEGAKAGIPGLIVEAGGLGPAFSMETVADVAQRLRNVLRVLEMLPGAVEQHGAVTFFSNFAWVTATRGGLFKRAVQCGQRVAKGQIVARFYDVFGELVEETPSPEDGVVLATGAGPLMPPGEIVVHIGLNPRAA
jgi:uncharacterized protein